eukprot:scaffold20395_cov128-Isochrysis_galbana.AAC.6
MYSFRLALHGSSSSSRFATRIPPRRRRPQPTAKWLNFEPGDGTPLACALRPLSLRPPLTAPDRSGWPQPTSFTRRALCLWAQPSLTTRARLNSLATAASYFGLSS